MLEEPLTMTPSKINSRNGTTNGRRNRSISDRVKTIARDRDYEISRVLGEGAFSVVYLAEKLVRERQPNNEVVTKVEQRAVSWLFSLPATAICVSQ